MVENSEDSTVQVLMEQAAQHDPVARGRLLERYRDRLRRMVAGRIDKRLLSRVDPSDVVQDALNNAYGRLTNYFANPAFSFYPWLRSIAWERLIDLYRTHVKTEKRSVLKEACRIGLVTDESDSASNQAQALADGGSACRRLLLAEMRQRLNDALNRLDPRDRDVLVLRYIEQLSVEETAAALNMSRTAVTTRHLRALKRLKLVLGDDAEILTP